MDYDAENQKLFQIYVVTEDKKSVEDKFLQLNQFMFYNILKKVYKMDNRVHGTKNDIMQIIQLNYILELRKYRESGISEYPFKIFKIVENDTKEELHNNYAPYGVKMSYRTKKQQVNSGTYISRSNDVEAYDSIINGWDDVKDEAVYKYKQMSDGTFCFGGYEDAERKAASGSIRSCLNMALNLLSPEDRELVLRRALRKEKWHDIGVVFGVTEGGARKRFKNAIGQLESYCKKYGLEECL